MDELRRNYELLKSSGLLYDYFPTLTGDFEKDLEEYVKQRKQRFNIDEPTKDSRDTTPEIS